MKPRIYERIADIDPVRWDGVGKLTGTDGEADPFSTHAALSALESAGLPGVRLWYATLEDSRGRWIAAAPLARVEIDGGRLSRGLFHSLITGVRSVFPSFLHTTVTICGTPLFVGNPPARFAAEGDRPRILRTLAGLLSNLADEQRAPWRGFKEFSEGETSNVHTVLERSGWILVPSEPNIRIALPWSDYDEYLRSLRSDYRYKIRKASRKMVEAGIEVEVLPLKDGYDHTVHRLYDAVVDRAAAQLEHLTPAFFTAFGRAFGDAAAMIRLRRDDRVVGWVAMLFNDGVAFDMFHGIDYAENARSDLYFNQLAEVIRLALRRGARILSMGQSTEIAKTRFGGRLVPLWAAIRHRNPAVNALLRTGRRHLFPARSAPIRHVFRDETAHERTADPDAPLEPASRAT